MDVTLPIAGKRWTISLDAALDWTVPTLTGEQQTAAFGLRRSTASAVEVAPNRRLMVAEGGSVNCADLYMNPHGAGTHTECIGHVSYEGRHVRSLHIPALLPATVISLIPVRLGSTNNTYDGQCHVDDRVLPVEPLARAISALVQPGFDAAIVLRTREDDAETVRWSGRNPVYLTREAMAFLASLPTQHLLIDLPSIDREQDGGGVPNHLRWWGLPPGVRRQSAATEPERSLTEMVRVPQSCADGAWVLNLQVPALGLDAAPSRVLAWQPRP